MYCYNDSGKQAPERIMKVKAAGSYLISSFLNGDALHVACKYILFSKLCFSVSYKYFYR